MHLSFKINDEMI